MQAGRKTYQDSSEVDWAPLTLSGAQTLCLPSFGPLSDKRKATGSCLMMPIELMSPSLASAMMAARRAVTAVAFWRQ